MSNEYLPEQEELNETEEKTSKIILDIAIHIVLVTVSFLMIFGMAIVLDLGIHYLEVKKVLTENTPILYALYIAKYTILMADCTLLLSLVYKLTVRAIRKI